MKKSLTLNSLKRNKKFLSFYKKFLLEELNIEERKKILSIIVLFLNANEKDINEFSYRILLIYSIKTKNFNPLYEISVNKGLYPICKKIFDIDKNHKNIYTEINDIEIKNHFKIDNIIRTYEQKKLFDEISESQFNSHIIVAPTSYGKTELMIKIISNLKKGENICILTPTKSLLSQTTLRVKEKYPEKKIITNPEMYNGKDCGIVAILTQERYLRLLQTESELKFDHLIIDEAHNILDAENYYDSRSILLAALIILSKNRNADTFLYYLTPIINSPDNLLPKYIKVEPKKHIIDEVVKSEFYYFYDIFENKSYIYEQYLNKFIPIDNKIPKDNEICKDDIDIIKYNNSKKNIIYLNKPKLVQDFALKLAKSLKNIDNKVIDNAIEDLKKFVHKDYDLIKCLKKGVIYHHGSVPENIRKYIENLYSEVPEIKYIVTNSTLLEGVNLPATSLFILEPKKGRKNLNASNFKNLVGRICRFNEIFNSINGNLAYLLPKIHIIKGKYCASNFNKQNFANDAIYVGKEREDTVENPLLKNNQNRDRELREKSNEFLTNISDNMISNGKIAKTFIGKSMFKNNVKSIDIIKYEYDISEKIEQIDEISNVGHLLDIINYLFISKIEEKSNYNMLKRLKNNKARNFYSMLYEWRINKNSLYMCVNSIVNYWIKSKENLVYVGKWGDKKRFGINKYWTNIHTKSKEQLVNLAIVRLKEEYDFVDNELIKYIEILFENNVLNTSFYELLKYGTNNQKEILLISNGFSFDLITLLKKYEYYINFNYEEKEVNINRDILKSMSTNEENTVLINELKYFI